MKAWWNPVTNDDKKIRQKEVLMRDVVGRNLQEDLISEIVRRSREKGDLDNLPGKGKPLNLDNDSEVPPEDRIVNRVMKSNNILPPWIQLDKEIREGMEQLEQLRLSSTANKEAKLVEMIYEINKKIEKFNLTCPVSLLQKRKLKRDEML
jgi:hypothetical protein